MPTIESKANWAKLKVGIMAVFAMVILAVLIFLITGNGHFFQSRATLYTYFDDAATLTKGAPVYLNGIPVGSVKDIALSGLSTPGKIVRVTMDVDASKLSSIPVDSQTSLGAANVLGTKFVNIRKGKSTETVHDGSTLPSLNTAEFEDVVQQGYAVLTSLQHIVERVDRIVGLVESGQGSIGKLLVDPTLYKRIIAITDSVQQLTNALNSPRGSIGKLIYDPALYNDLQATLGRVNGLIEGVERGEGTAGKLLKDPKLYNDLDRTVDDLHRMLAGIDAGQGTVGKLLKSDELHNQIRDTLGKIDTMLDKINAGQGTIGQLMVNPQLYDNLNGSTRELHELLKDFRANPKKFLRIKLSLF